MNTKTTRRPIKSSVSAISKAPKKLVRIAGLEPARLAALPPQSSVSANSTISANRRKLQHATAWTQVHSGPPRLHEAPQTTSGTAINFLPNSNSDYGVDMKRD